MERPDINSKRYIYYHKKLGKKMFNNQKYLDDCKMFSEQNVVLPQGDVIKSVCPDCNSENVTKWSDGEFTCYDCKKHWQTVL